MSSSVSSKRAAVLEFRHMGVVARAAFCMLLLAPFLLFRSYRLCSLGGAGFIPLVALRGHLVCPFLLQGGAAVGGEQDGRFNPVPRPAARLVHRTVAFSAVCIHQLKLECWHVSAELYDVWPPLNTLHTPASRSSRRLGGSDRCVLG
jgi:hypothetical protein